MKSSSVKTIAIVLLYLVKSVKNQLDADDPLNDPDTQDTFRMNDRNENVLQRKYTILVNQKAEDCYHITNVKLKRTLSVVFMVSFGPQFINIILFYRYHYRFYRTIVEKLIVYNIVI